ncbi:TraB/GumN family protein [Alteriqipengyuania sp. 357]
MTSMMKKLAAGCAAIALSFGTAACAQEANTSDVASASTAIADSGSGAPALWRVADEDTTIYIFGTVHALPDDVEWYSGPVKTALDESDTLVTEVDMTPGAQAEIGALVGQIAVLPEDTTLRSLLTDEQRLVYEATLTDMGLPVAALDRLEPWMAALSISQIALQQAGITGENGTEKVLEGIVGEAKGRDALETAAFQLAIFDELPQEAQIDYLMEMIAEIDQMVPMLQEIIGEWSEGDVAQLGALMNEALEADPVLAERLLYARNANWAVWIDDRLDAPGTIFMAVGAGHMAGNQKLQDKLAARGIEMVRVQ